MGIESVPKFEKEPTTVYLSVQTNFLSDLVVKQAYNDMRKDYEAGSVGIAVIQLLSGTNMLTTTQNTSQSLMLMIFCA